jgi:hypothetical protein
MSYGPLSLLNPAGTTILGNYSINTGSVAVDHGLGTGAPTHDFFGNPRPRGAGVDIGAVELPGAAGPPATTVSITPNPLTITLPNRPPNGGTNTGTVTFTNTTPAGGASVTISNVTVPAGPTPLQWFFNKVIVGANSDHCTGATLAPGQSCTVGVRFTNLIGSRPATHAGTITFTDNAPGSPHTGALNGVAP